MLKTVCSLENSVIVILLVLGLEIPSPQLISLDHLEIYSKPPITVLDNGNLVVADQDSGKILFLDLNGKLIRKRGGKGSGPGEFETIINLTWDRHNQCVRVSDSANTRFTEYDQNGNLQRTVKHPSGNFFHHLAWDSNRFFAPTEEPETKEIGLTVYFMENKPPRNLFIQEGAVPTDPIRTTLNGQKLIFPPFWAPKLLFTRTKNTLITVWSANKKIVLRNDQGKILSQFAIELPTNKIELEQITSYFSDLSESQKAIILKDIHPPENWPVIQSIMADDKDRIWVFGWPNFHRNRLPFAAYDLNGQQLKKGELTHHPKAMAAGAIYSILEENDQIWIEKFKIIDLN